MLDNKEIRQRTFLIEELDVCVSTIIAGLLVLQKMRFYSNNHFASFLLLATGLERLMKIILHLHSFESQGTFLSSKEIKRYGHDLNLLCDDVISKCFTSNYLQTSC